MKKTSLLLLGLFLGLPNLLVFPSHVYSSELHKNVSPNPFILEVKDGLVSLHAFDTNFKHILKELAKQTKIVCHIDDKVEDRDVSLSIQNLPLFALSNLLEMMGLNNYAVAYDPSFMTEVIYVLPAGFDPAAFMADKSVIQPALFPSGKRVERIKGKGIFTLPRDQNTGGGLIRYVQDEVILKFYPGVNSKEIEGILETHGLQASIEQRGFLSKIGIMKVMIPQGREVMSMVGELAKERKIKKAEPNFIAAVLTEKDPLYKNQYYLAQIHFDKVFDKLGNQTRVRVAVIDSGVDPNHPDLVGRILEGYDFVEDIPEVRDPHGHGTFVAGIIAANPNQIGIRGLSDNAEIVPVRVIDGNGIGTYEDVAKGIIYAVDHGAKVINLSLGGYASSLLLEGAVDYALENGCILVASGGNDGLKMAVYPAAYPGVIGVGAIGRNGDLLGLSNRGKHIGVVAPGENILSTGLMGQYAYATGTSVAAPMVSALAAMLFSERADLSSTAIHRLILQSAKDLGPKGRDKSYGNGLIQADAALEQEVKRFHDAAVRRVGVGPRTWEKGKPAFIIANIENAGTYKSEECALSLTLVMGEEKKLITKKTGLVVNGKMRVEFEWVPGEWKENLRFEVSLHSPRDSDRSNNSKLSNQFDLKEDGQVYILHKTDPPVHQWAAYQAKFIWSNAEMSGHLPGSWSNSTSTLDNYKILYGLRMEDDDNASDACYPLDSCSPCSGWDWDSGYSGNHPYCNHFWDPDGGPDAGLNVFGRQWQSAYRRAQHLWDEKVTPLYQSGQLDQAYYWLGRIAHLLVDLSVPAHVHLDTHPVVESYESYMGEYNDDVSNHYNFAQWTASGLASPASNLFSLFQDIAEKADEFDSNDASGESPGHKEGHNDAWETQNGVYGWYDTSYAECRIHGNTLMPEAIRHVAGLYKLFWQSTHVSNKVDFDGDSHTDILVQNQTTGSIYIWYMNGTTFKNEQYLSTVADPRWKIVGIANFNQDGYTDILWQNQSTGEIAVWFLDGGNSAQPQGISTVGDPDWKIVGAGDFNGDGKPDILWRHQNTGEVAVWCMNGASLAYPLGIATVEDTRWRIVGTGDFNGDGKADILWRHQITGEVAVWLMDGTNLILPKGIGTIGNPDWKIVGVGDFNGDTKSDIVWRNLESGQVYVWLMDGAIFTGEAYVRTTEKANWIVGGGEDQGSETAGWEIVGVADFNQNAHGDILLQNQNTGEVKVWFMSGAAFAGEQKVGTVADSNWKIAATGDFNRDGRPDILWHHQTTGEAAVWLMNGTGLLSPQGIALVGDTSWKIVGTGDFNGDGKVDLLWHHQTTGAVYAWYMDGANFVSDQHLGTVGELNWKIVGVGDFNGDGKVDLLWHHGGSGDVYVWYMNGAVFLGDQKIATVGDLNWKIRALGDFNRDGNTDILWHNQITGDVYVWFMNRAVFVGDQYIRTAK